MIDAYVRKIVLVDQDFMNDLKSTSVTDFKAFNSPDIDTKVIALPSVNADQIAELIKVVDPSELRCGNVLVRPEYCDHFVPISEFSEELVLRRFGVFVQLCIALGAKRVKLTNVDEIDLEQSSKSVMGGGTNVSVPIAKGDINAKVEQSSKIDEIRSLIMKIHTEAEGGPPNLPEAERILDMYVLRREALFMDIYNMRRVSTNRLTSHQVSIDFTKDVKRFFDSSLKFKLQAMNKLYQGRGEFDMNMQAVEKNKTATKLSVLVEF
jgi:hypothetical protein